MTVHPGDWMVADSEGILCLPAAQAPALLDRARQAEAKEAAQSLAAWQAEHRRKVDAALARRSESQDPLLGDRQGSAAFDPNAECLMGAVGQK